MKINQQMHLLCDLKEMRKLYGFECHNTNVMIKWDF